MRVKYAGLEFSIVKTNSFHREPVTSEDGTELLYMRTTYDLVMVFAPHAGSFIEVLGAGVAAIPGTPPAETDKAIRYLLLQPRKTFELLSDNGEEVLIAPAPGFACDPDNGPKPLACNVVAVAAKTWRVQWRVQVATVECRQDVSTSIPPMLSNRWTQTQETGPDCLTRTTTRGLTIFRADALQSLNRTADYYRSQCIPALPLGFQRQAVSATLSPAGNALTWQVVDQETMVPIGDTDDPRRGGVQRFEASFAMSSTAPDKDGKPSLFTIAQFDAAAWGTKTSSRASMLSWLARLAIERCAIPNGRIDPNLNPLILRATVGEKIDQPFVELHLTIQFPPAKDVRQGFGPLRTDFLGIDVINLFANDGKSPNLAGDNNTRGTTDAALFAAAIKQACQAPTLPDVIPTVSGYPDDNYRSAYVPEVEVTIGPPPTSISAYKYEATSMGTYTEMSVDASWKTDSGKMQVPLAAPVGDGTYVPGGGDQSGGDGPDSVVLTLSRPTTTVEFRFEAERTSFPPILPDPNIEDPNFVLLFEEVSPMAVGVATDGQTPVYRVGGVYRYAAKKARKPGTPFPFGVHPWTRFLYEDVVMPVANFQRGIISDAMGFLGYPRVTDATPIGPDQ